MSLACRCGSKKSKRPICPYSGGSHLEANAPIESEPEPTEPQAPPPVVEQPPEPPPAEPTEPAAPTPVDPEC